METSETRAARSKRLLERLSHHMAFSQKLGMAFDACCSECGTVDAPGWVLPLGAVLVIGTSLLPLALKDGEEAFDDIKERDAGFFGKTRGD